MRTQFPLVTIYTIQTIIDVLRDDIPSHRISLRVWQFIEITSVDDTSGVAYEVMSALLVQISRTCRGLTAGS